MKIMFNKQNKKFLTCWPDCVLHFAGSGSRFQVYQPRLRAARSRAVLCAFDFRNLRFVSDIP